MKQQGPFEESRTITDFFKPSKPNILQAKREAKDKEECTRSRRKNSTQMSIFGWLVKSRPKQHSLFMKLSKNIIVNIYAYLRVCEIIQASQCCIYLNECAKSIWHDLDFFSQVDTDKLTTIELKKVIEKGGKMGHIQQLRSIYRGKNIKACREKIRLKVKSSPSQKPISGKLLEAFQISPQSKKSNAFLMDNHLQEVINSSFRSLTSIKLHSCHYIHKLTDIYKCQQLITLVVTNNSYISVDDLRLVCKCCSKIEVLDLSGCDGLDQGIFKYIAKLEKLKTLSLSNYHQPFGDLQVLGSLTNLTQICLQNSSIVDNEALQLLKAITGLKQLNITGCRFLTDFFLQGLLQIYISAPRRKTVTLIMNRNEFSDPVLHEYQQQIWKREKNQ